MPESPLSPTSATEWKKKGGKTPTPQPMPSGNIALVKIPGADIFFKQGMVPNSLKGTIQEAITKGEAPKMQELEEQAEDRMALIQDILALANAVCVEAVVEPRVLPCVYTEQDHALGLCTAEQIGQVIPEHDRDKDALYVDEVDLEDRMFIMQLAFGGTRDLDKFRQGLEGDVELVPASKTVPKPTKRTGGPRKR